MLKITIGAVMKKLFGLLVLLLFVTSCTSIKNINKEINQKVAGYSLKDNKEKMQQEVLKTTRKTVVALP